MNNNPPPNSMNEEEWEAEKKERRTRKKNILVKGLTLLTRHPKEKMEKNRGRRLEVENRRMAKEVRSHEGKSKSIYAGLGSMDNG